MGPKLYWDNRGDQPNEITAFIHCGQCLTEWDEDPTLSSSVSPKDFARTQTGTTANGAIQVWCNRHEKNVVIMSGEPREGLTYGTD